MPVDAHCSQRLLQQKKSMGYHDATHTHHSYHGDDKC